MTYQRRIGNLGEQIAADFLGDLGYKLLDQNYHTPYGELDLIMLDSEILVFAEVKTRTTNSFGSPESSITQTKLERIHNSALLWLQSHLEQKDDWRVDVVAIILNSEGRIQDIQHFINVNL
jgi:putative endonuclease